MVVLPIVPDIIERVAYKPKQFISRSSNGWMSVIRLQSAFVLRTLCAHHSMPPSCFSLTQCENKEASRGSFSWDFYKLITQSTPRTPPTDSFTLAVKTSTCEFGVYTLYSIACMVCVLFLFVCFIFLLVLEKWGRFLMESKINQV